MIGSIPNHQGPIKVIRLILGGGGFKNLFIFTPTWENDPIWRACFQIGWDHHLELIIHARNEQDPEIVILSFWH